MNSNGATLRPPTEIETLDAAADWTRGWPVLRPLLIGIGADAATVALMDRAYLALAAVLTMRLYACAAAQQSDPLATADAPLAA